MVMNIRVLVLGSGISGLSAAYYLSRSGLHPLVLERAGHTGGQTPYQLLCGLLERKVPVVKNTRILHVSAFPEQHRVDVEIQRPGKKKETLTAHRVLFALPPEETATILQAVSTGIRAAKKVMQSIG